MTKMRLGDIYEFQFGEGNTNPSNDGQFPVYGSNGIIGHYTIFNSEDAPIIGHIGANAGCVVYGYGKHFVTYNGIICKVKDGFDKMYAYYLLHTLKLQERAKGSAQPFLTYDMLNNINIENVLSLDAQQKAGRILCDIDAQIQRNNDMVHKLQLNDTTISCFSMKGKMRYAS